jgi:prepilin signal peptidase PulO-like enzyme (type II secretory pathway)
MLNTAGYIILLILAIQISVYDFKTHYIKNIDLILLFLTILIFLDFNLILGFANLAIYLALYLLTNRQLGLGDVKLSFLIGLVFSSLYDLVIALNISWISGGVWAIFRKEAQIAFAPWMLLGAFISQIMMN